MHCTGAAAVAVGGGFRHNVCVIQDDEHLLTVLRYIKANPLRAKLVERAGDYPPQ